MGWGWLLEIRTSQTRTQQTNEPLSIWFGLFVCLPCLCWGALSEMFQWLQWRENRVGNLTSCSCSWPQVGHLREVLLDPPARGSAASGRYKRSQSNALLAVPRRLVCGCRRRRRSRVSVRLGAGVRRMDRLLSNGVDVETHYRVRAFFLERAEATAIFKCSSIRTV